MKRKTNNKRNGFTLVELLTTLAVIGVLLGLMIPALNMVSKTATKVKQKAQLYAIGTALEGFRNDYQDYPPSVWDGASYGAYSASQRLAEALVGRDGFGFHPNSRFTQDGLDAAGNPLYAPAVDLSADPDNLAARQGPYLELENANAVRLANLDINHNLTASAATSYVLVDMYKINKNAATGKEVGMPIMYYRANKMQVGSSEVPADWDTNTYNIEDSYCGSWGIIDQHWGTGRFQDDETGNAKWFYDTIANPNFTSPARPYRAESFLLHSAGPDGLYGTGDDIFNFDQDN